MSSKTELYTVKVKMKDGEWIRVSNVHRIDTTLLTERLILRFTDSYNSPQIAEFDTKDISVKIVEKM